MKKLMIRAVALLLSVSLLVPALTLPAFAEGMGDTGGYDNDSVALWNSYIPTSTFDTTFITGAAAAFDLPYSATDVFWRFVDEAVASSRVGEIGFDELVAVCDHYNSIFNLDLGDGPLQWLVEGYQTLSSNFLAAVFFAGPVNFEVQEWGSSGLYRIVETGTGIPVCDSLGRYACASYAKGGEEVRGRHWRPASEASSHVVQMKPVNRQSNHSLAAINEMIMQTGIDSQIRTIANKYNAIWYDYQYYCDANGYPFVAPMEEDHWGVNQDRVDTEVRDENGDPAVDEDGEVIEENNEGNSTNIDFSGMTITLPTGDLILADSVLYDESTKTYQIDARQFVEEGDTYIYNTYEYTYHINYTSITYIGQTEEYSKYYEVYYELPDGRSSADLTKEELEQLNVSMDVIPYGRSADDTSLRSLYHFDGDTRDSSYWNYCTDFTWNKGASLTYMDAGVFDGALYLDENEHDFTITLPSAIGTGDFTLQFRYYQSHTAAPVNDSWFLVGNSSKSACFNGAALLDGGGNHLADMPIGSWNEIALIRSNGQYCFYLNGLPLISGGWPTALDNKIQFHFGSQQQTFKYLDELRVLNRALVEAGVSYEPTSVPHDTNLTLVLPDSAAPVADEYWSFDTTITPVATWDFTGFNGQSYQFLPDSVTNQDPALFSSTTYTPATQYDGFTLIEGVNSTWDSPANNASYRDSEGGFGAFRYRAGFSAVLFFPYAGTSMSGLKFYMVGKGLSYYASGFDLSDITAHTYTFSVVLDDGTLNSLTFTIPYGASNYSIVASEAFDWGRLALTTGYSGISESHSYLPYSITILPDTGKSVSIVYAELVEGSTPNTGHEFVGSVTAIDREDLNTPTLAVRTDVTITSHQIGGPRPSVPTKGQVWALVEDGTIRSLQIYNGTAWEAVDGRIWTGSRWVPASSYNIITLQDLYDIKDATQDYEYIYTETGFWSWWQKAWNKYVADVDKRFDELIKALGGGSEPETDCEHIYTTKVIRDPGCVEPGLQRYTCGSCGHSYTETIDATGHDWLVVDRVEPVLDEEGNVLEEGYDILECSVCGAESKDYGDGPVEDDLFDALGNFLADGIDWILGKLTELSDSLRSITDTFTSFATKVGELAGGFPAFFGAFIVLIPEDLRTIMWFAVIGFVVLCVYKKWAR